MKKSERKDKKYEGVSLADIFSKSKYGTYGNLKMKPLIITNSFHLLRKTFVVGSIKKGFENGDHLSLVKVSRLIGHSNVSTTLRYTNFETNQMLNLYELG